MSAKACAQRIFDKCDTGIARTKYAVLLTDDRRDVRLTKPGTELFDRILRLDPERVVGVYDLSAKEADIEADLICAGFVS